MIGQQAKIYDAVEAHIRQETLRGSEIKPAATKQVFSSESLTKADKSKFTILLRWDTCFL
jgi:hypothetical protein